MTMGFEAGTRLAHESSAVVESERMAVFPPLPDWYSDAACSVPAALKVDFQSSATADVRRARAFCAACPVIRQCLQRAVEENEMGVWGGTTRSERLEKFGRPVRKPKPERVKKPVKVKAPKPPGRIIPGAHGTVLHYGHGCRCPECKAAMSAYSAARYRQRRCREAGTT